MPDLFRHPEFSLLIEIAESRFVRDPQWQSIFEMDCNAIVDSYFNKYVCTETPLRYHTQHAWALLGAYGKVQEGASGAGQNCFSG